MLSRGESWRYLIVRLLIATVLSLGGLAFWPPPARAEVIGLQGEVAILPPQAQAYRPVKLLDPLPPGTKIRTGDQGLGTIFFAPNYLLTLGPDSEVEVKETPGGAGPPEGNLTLQVKAGRLRFILKSPSPAARCRLLAPHTLVTAAAGEGVLILDGRDRVVYLKGASPILLKNAHSGHEVRLSPWRQATSQADGRISDGGLEVSEAKALSQAPVFAAVTPPPGVLAPPKPTPTPITLADQMRLPWPVLPPVRQTPHIWLGANGTLQSPPGRGGWIQSVP